MSKCSEEVPSVANFAPVGPGSRLPYTIEVLDAAGLAVERVVGRAATRSVAITIFKAAVTEQPGRQIVMRRGTTVLQSAGG